MIYTVSFKPKNIDEIQRIEVDATDEKDAKEKAKQRVSGPVGEISVVSIVKGGRVVKGPKHFEALTEIKDELFDAPSDVKEAFNNVTEYFAKKSPEETYKDWIKALKIGEKALKMLNEIDAVNCILSGGDPFIWEEGTENIDKIKTKLESQVNHIKKLLKNRGVKYFDIYDEFGSSVRIGDEIIFYYENGVEELHESDVKTPRLYKGTLKSWDKQNLIATISTKDFDQTHYGLPKEVKVGQRLISKIK